MYYILGVPFQVFNFFMEAFKYQQEKYNDKPIIYSKDGVSEVVWKPAWENLNCEDL